MRKTLEIQKIDSQALAAVKNYHADIVTEVENAVESNDVVIVGMSMNPVVKSARKMLDEKNVKYKYLEYGNYFSMWKPRLAIKLWSGWPTFPQVFHKGILIGGGADLKKYLENNKLNA
jgi:monothiol glutaredoxin